MEDTAKKRISVQFGVDLDTKTLSDVQKRLEALRPGTVEYSVAWDELKALHTHFIGRLEGECQAYMNIAREEAKQTFGV